MLAQKDHPEQRTLLRCIWAFPVVVPLFLILFSYILLSWSWGLMDDLQLLEIPGGIVHRAKDVFMVYFAFGECKWTHALYCAFFYKIFANAPRLFYVFKWAEVLGMIFVWGAAAYQLTGRRTVLFLVPAIALSFHYIYDQFFFLSTHETTGLLFLGLALWCMVKAIFRWEDTRKDFYIYWVMAVIYLLLALGSKETFVSSGFALGVGVGALYWISRPSQIWHLGSGLLLAAFFAAYGILLKKFVSSAYTAQYNFFNLTPIVQNFKVWASKDLLNHTPWILAMVVLWFWAKKNTFTYTLVEKWGILLGVLLYFGFLFVLLPWDSTSYYAGPLGIFFAFAAAIFLAPLLESVSLRWNFVLVTIALVFNLFIAQYALTREQTYHQNTQDLWQWIKGNKEFQQADRLQRIDCDGMEPGAAIPGHANRQWGLGLQDFRYQTDIKQAFQEDIKYFVHSPRFGSRSIDTSGWETVFYSQYWQVYQRIGG